MGRIKSSTVSRVSRTKPRIAAVRRFLLALAIISMNLAFSILRIFASQSLGAEILPQNPMSNTEPFHYSQAFPFLNMPGIANVTVTRM
jgi:hypothetical protein